MFKNLKKNPFFSNQFTSSLLHNTFVLYFLFLVSLMNVYYLSFEGDILSLSVFCIVGLLTSFFKKNMIVILFLALTITNIIKYGGNLPIQ